ncbi:7TM diverse intracellular signaling domain-containing protein [Larkinella sp.]|uniref:7TM diverse intracellular signaling domain-containing protein n=1 Tax=Larkinella sp. TaxID=2034517 RepID=UPI003BAA0D16
MKNRFLFVVFLFSTECVLAQPPYTLTNRSAAQITSYAVLPDQGYSLDEIRTDTTLRFITGDSLRPSTSPQYWLKLVIINPSYYDEPYNLTVIPSLNNTLYYFDANAGQWISHQAGVTIPYPKRRNRSLLAFLATGKTATTLYIKVDLTLFQAVPKAIKPAILLEKKATTDRRYNLMLITWITSLTVLFLFFLNNLFIYFNFRDKIVLYYLLSQVGGMVYLTDFKQFFQLLFPCPVFTVGFSAEGQFNYFDLGHLLQHLGIVLILYGQVQLTRAYLNTSIALPRLDAALKYGLYGYSLLSLAIVIINSCWVYLENYTLWYHNIVSLLVIGGIMSACILGYVRGLPAARPFLLANILPLAFMLGIALYHVFVTYSNTDALFLPDLAILSQALAFSIALIARTKTIQKELIARKIETQQLGFDMREMELKHRLSELENQKISADIRHEKTRNEWLQERLDTNQRELASTTLYLVQKNELLSDLKSQLLKLNKQFPTGSQQGLKGIESILQSSQYLDADWAKFKIHFEQVHPDFFENLLAKHPSLTKYEIRLYAYFHINLSTKEIAALLNIDPASVRRAKTRLYKKMAITSSVTS